MDVTPVKSEGHDDTSAMLAALQSTNKKEVSFFPLYGHDASAECFCSVLHINGQNILLDCGWNEACDVDLLAPLRLVAPFIHVVVLSHADIAHTGALPYAVAKLGLRTDNIYCTLPVQHLGHLALYELLASRHDISDFDEFSYDDIDVAFEAIQGVRFGQQVLLSVPASDADNDARGGPSKPSAVELAESAAAGLTLQLTAHPAGHSLGGAMWQISLLEQDFVYAVKLTLKQDSHLKGCTVHSDMHRPALLVTDCSGRTDPPSSQGDQFCRFVATAVKEKQGHVLVPVDSTARVFELLILLDRHWTNHGMTVPIVLLARTALSTLMKARAQLEFLSENIQKRFARGRGGNPFELPNVHATSHVEALSTLPNNSSLVVLAPLPSLDSGPARQLFLDCGWAADPKNTIILPFGATGEGTLAARLVKYAETTIQSQSPMVMSVEVARRVPLTQEELEERKAAADATTVKQEEHQDIEMKDIEADGNPATSDEVARGDDSDHGGASGPLPAARGHTAAIAQQMAGGGHTHVADAENEAMATNFDAFEGVLIDGFRIPEGAAAPMFPGPPPPPEWDAFGAKLDLHALFGQEHHADDDLDSDIDVQAHEALLQGGGVELPTLDLASSKVVHERVTLQVRAHITMFDFRSLISQSSFVSMVRNVAPRNLVLLRRPPPNANLPALKTSSGSVQKTLVATVRNALQGAMSRIHTPSAGEVVCMSSIAAYAAMMTQQLSQLVEGQTKTVRGGYRLGWLDSVAEEYDEKTGCLLLGVRPPDMQDDHTGRGVLLGNMMVSDITQRLREQDIPVEQDGELAKVGEGQDAQVLVYPRAAQAARNTLVVEGGISRMFYRVRDEVYNHCRLVPN